MNWIYIAGGLSAIAAIAALFVAGRHAVDFENCRGDRCRRGQ